MAVPEPKALDWKFNKGCPDFSPLGRTRGVGWRSINHDVIDRDDLI